MQFLRGTIIVRHDATYPQGALVVSGYSETGELLAYPKGGGAEFRIPASDITKFSAVTEGEQTPIYRRSNFALEGVEETFSGWSNGELWNGWAMPKFAFDEAQRIIAALNLADGRFDAPSDAFITTMSDDHEVWPAEVIELPDGGSLKAYGVGAGSWIWEECDEEDAE